MAHNLTYERGFEDGKTAADVALKARLAEAEHLILRMAGEDYQRARFYVEKYDLTGERAAVSASGGA